MRYLRIGTGCVSLFLIFSIFYFGIKSYKNISLKKDYSTQIDGIACWGDSLTYGVGGEGITYPNVLQQYVSEKVGKISVYNLGVGGESSKQVMARNGALGIKLAEDLVIPDSQIPIKIEIELSDGSDAAILRQGDYGIEEVRIGSVFGSLSIKQESITSEDYTYYFTRKYDGKEERINSGTQIEVVSSRKYKDDIIVIFMGTNGVWSTPEELIGQIQSMIDGQFHKELYVVIGLSTGTAEERVDLENEMEKEFGKHYINLREYLSTEGLDDAGLLPTEEDLKNMEEGIVPVSLRSDDVHLNATGYELLGKLVYERMAECGFWENIEYN